MPKPPAKYSRPLLTQLESPSSGDDDGYGNDDDELVQMSRKALREVCKGLDPQDIPQALRAVLAGASSSEVIPMQAQEATRLMAQPRAAVVTEDTEVGRRLQMQVDTLGETGLQQTPQRQHTQEIAEQPSQQAANQKPQPITTLVGQIDVGEPQEVTAPKTRPNYQRGKGQLTVIPRTISIAPRMYRDKGDMSGSGAALNEVILEPRAKEDSGDKSLTLQQIRSTTRQKRKSNLQVKIPSRPTGSTKKSMLPGPSTQQPIKVSLNTEGLYEVHVDYTHCMGLASGLGIKPVEVVTEVEEDNNERRAQLGLGPRSEEDTNLEEEEPMDQSPVRFDPYTDDELDSDIE